MNSDRLGMRMSGDEFSGVCSDAEILGLVAFCAEVVIADCPFCVCAFDDCDVVWYSWFAF